MEWYGLMHTCRMLTYLRPEPDHGWNAEGLYQVLLFAIGACEHAWIIKDTRTQFNTRIFHGMVVRMLAVESCFNGLWSCRKNQRLWTVTILFNNGIVDQRVISIFAVESVELLLHVWIMHCGGWILETIEAVPRIYGPWPRGL